MQDPNNATFTAATSPLKIKEKDIIRSPKTKNKTFFKGLDKNNSSDEENNSFSKQFMQGSKLDLKLKLNSPKNKRNMFKE